MSLKEAALCLGTSLIFEGVAVAGGISGVVNAREVLVMGFAGAVPAFLALKNLGISEETIMSGRT